jgi:hypothetical protein
MAFRSFTFSSGLLCILIIYIYIYLFAYATNLDLRKLSLGNMRVSDMSCIHVRSRQQFGNYCQNGDISDSHGGEYEDDSLQGYSAV